MLDKIRSLLKSEGHISNLDDKLSSDIQGIKIHHAGIDGVDENRIVIREYYNGSSGDLLLTVEYNEVDDKWVVYDSNSQELDQVSGRSSYAELSEVVETRLKNL